MKEDVLLEEDGEEAIMMTLNLVKQLLYGKIGEIRKKHWESRYN